MKATSTADPRDETPLFTLKVSCQAKDQDLTTAIAPQWHGVPPLKAPRSKGIAPPPGRPLTRILPPRIFGWVQPVTDLTSPPGA